MLLSTQAESNWTYKEACQVIEALKAVGVECGVTVGGIWLSFDLEAQGVSVVRIIKENGGVFCHQTMMQGLSLENAHTVKMKNAIAELERLWNA